MSDNQDAMNGDFSELVEYLDEKFQAIDLRFESVDKRFSYLDGKFARIDEQFAENAREHQEIKEAFTVLQTSVDGIAAQFQAQFQETQTLSSRVQRHDNQIQKIAAETGVKLD